MKRGWYIAAAALTFAGCIITRAPAASIYGWITAKRPSAEVTLYGLEGTLGDGRAAGIFVNGHPALNDLHWSLQTWRLLLAQAAFKIDGGGELMTLDGLLAFSPLGGTRLSSLHARSGVRTLLTAAGQPFLPIDGIAKTDLANLKLHGKQLVQATGRIQVQNLAWTLARDPVLLGDFQADIRTDNDVIVARLTSVGQGAVEANGEARLKPDQSYELNLQLHVRAQANPMVQNLIGALGQPDSQGWIHLRQQGRLQ